MNIDNEYVVLQAKYRKVNDNNKEDLFPNEWYNVKEYELKKEILKECLEKNILITESSLYQEFKLKALS